MRVRGRFRLRVVSTALVAISGLVAFPCLSLFGQERSLSSRIDGLLLDESTGLPIPQATIRLLDPLGQMIMASVTTQEGRFSLRTPGYGTFHLRSSALGYFSEESGEFSLPPGRIFAIEIRLAPSPLPMDSVVVAARRRPLRVTEQLIQGTLKDAITGDPVSQGSVSLLKAMGSGVDDVDLVEEVRTDRDGFFSFVTPLPGTYRLRGERMGYRTSKTQDLFLMPGDTLFLDLLMGVDAFVMDPLVVTASARPWGDRYSLMGMESFFHRQSRFGNSGSGTFLTRDSLAGYEGRLDTNRILLMSVRSVRALNDGGGVILPHGCNPRYYLNDVEIVRGDAVHEPMMGADPSTPMSWGMNLEAMYPPETLEAIEVYVSPTIPAEFSEGYPCGVVALWTRRR